MVNKYPNIPEQIMNTVKEYMTKRNYAQVTINMRLGNLNFLFGNYSKEKMIELLNTNIANVQDSIDFIESTLPVGCIVSADINAYKLAWESIHGHEIIRRINRH